MTTTPLEANSNYKIIELKEIETKYGKRYIVVDSELNQFWSNRKISMFIKQNKIPLNNNGKVLFRIKTGDYKTFKNNDGDEIKYLEMTVSFK